MGNGKLYICNTCGELLPNPEETTEEYCPGCGIKLLLNHTYKPLVEEEVE